MDDPPLVEVVASVERPVTVYTDGAPAYLDEFEFRFNNRGNPYIFRDAMKLLLASENVEYKELVA